MKVIYVGCFPKEYTDAMSQDFGLRFSNAAQKYNQLLIDGLLENQVEIHLICLADPLAALTGSTYKMQRKHSEHLHVYFPHYSPNKIGRIKNAVQLFQDVQKKSDCSTVILDCFSPYAWAIASKAKHLCCIVTDLPEFIYQKSTFSHRMKRTLIRHCLKKANTYVLLSEQMNGSVNPGNKPHIVIEGLVQNTLEPTSSLQKTEQILYSGAITKDCGIHTLCEAFSLINTNTHLVFYGAGDYVDELRQKCLQDSRIEYRGVVSNDEVVAEQKKSLLLVNPRPVDAVFADYSFPSKNLEYLASGTATLLTRLNSTPPEYIDHALFFPSSNKDGIKKGLEDALALSYDELERIGKNGQTFVQSHKNCLTQAARMLNLIQDHLSE